MAGHYQNRTEQNRTERSGDFVYINVSTNEQKRLNDFLRVPRYRSRWASIHGVCKKFAQNYAYKVHLDVFAQPPEPHLDPPLCLLTLEWCTRNDESNTCLIMIIIDESTC